MLRARRTARPLEGIFADRTRELETRPEHLLIPGGAPGGVWSGAFPPGRRAVLAAAIAASPAPATAGSEASIQISHAVTSTVRPIPSVRTGGAESVVSKRAIAPLSAR